MATDYDEPRKSETDQAPESLEELRTAQGAVRTANPDVDEADTAEGIELPGADLSAMELTVEVVPPKKDEFVCSSCFLVHHRSQLAREKNGLAYCLECEGS
ncbi:DUF4193 domain-containing protein [Pseudarthrobacter sp. J75]|uniref:DUF4193 domain-containing protein n=1 Tax=unclassified Pseudarthrobacter TaxID=2647000 RepID=UPI002E821880|nr:MULTISPECIES: DUF4193 domain-containing protein [unclassified Pseudarthrobacter]MEE2522500.1 DUF4193 domain-containing protein [Pseudarthrobacter sp. J47]MEE2529169.1 DUF4193 domain-containing protein [Pseudarthrobacter sp. J75]MEE2570456.1 DUF4193 domain-containing protein [Pseudarthrobacter sp. J64]